MTVKQLVNAPVQNRRDYFGGYLGTGQRLRAALRRRAETRRMNRAFRRNQREFEQVMNALADDPAAQRELELMWTLRD